MFGTNKKEKNPLSFITTWNKYFIYCPFFYRVEQVMQKESRLRKSN